MTYIDDVETHRDNQAYIRSAMRRPLLDGDRERELARRWRSHGDETSLHQLVSAYTRLCVSLAMKYRRYGLPTADLIQEGNLGLMQAAARFEPERGVRFSTYATWWIRARIQDFILRNWSIVRTGTTAAQKALFFNLRRLQARIGGDGERLSPDGCERIARTLNVRVADVIEMAGRLSQSDRSLNVVPGEDGSDEWQDLLPDLQPGPEDVAIAEDDTRMRAKRLAAALAQLSPRERAVIDQRQEEEEPTLEEIGRRLGVSKERVRQIEQRALAKLRTVLLGSGDVGELLAS
jgi:RNA polymerase sigma-32 factor